MVFLKMTLGLLVTGIIHFCAVGETKAMTWETGEKYVKRGGGYLSNSAARQRESTSIIWAFVLSLLLTGFAFFAVGTGMIENRTSLILFIVLLAFIQVSVQLLYFMHLKDKGHRFPVLFAVYAAFAAVIMIYGIVKWM